MQDRVLNALYVLTPECSKQSYVVDVIVFVICWGSDWERLNNFQDHMIDSNRTAIQTQLRDQALSLCNPWINIDC